MSDAKISALPSATVPLSTADIIPVVQGGVTKQAPLSALPATGGAPTGAAGGDLTGTYPNPQIAALAVTTAKTANNAITNAKLDQAPASTVKGNPTGSTANEQDVTMPILGPLISPYITAPLSTRSISDKMAAFGVNGMFEYTPSATVQMVAVGNAANYAICNIGTGKWTTGAVAAISTKNLAGGVYVPAIDRVIMLATTGELYVINPNTTPWTLDSAITSGVNPQALTFIASTNELITCTGGATLRKYNVAVNPPTLSNSYDPSGGTDTLAQVGYDISTDCVFATVGNHGLAGIQGRIYKVPRGSFASNSVANSATDQNPNTPANPIYRLAIASGYAYPATNTGLSIRWTTSPALDKRIYGIIGGQGSNFVVHPTNGFLYGYGSLGAFAKIDPAVYGYTALRPIDVVTGTGPAGKDILVGADGYIYALITDSAGTDVYQLNQ